MCVLCKPVNMMKPTVRVNQKRVNFGISVNMLTDSLVRALRAEGLRVVHKGTKGELK